jgi:predicted nucleic acid-binding protein
MKLQGAGDERISTRVAALIDTNILVYVFDPSDRRKQQMAVELLERGLAEDSVRIPHQAIVEFVAAVTRPRGRERPLLSKLAAYREAEELLSQFVILYPEDALLRTALRGAAAYQLGWFDAHMWAYAEHYGLTELFTEDFEHGRLYGTVRAVNPFLE